MARPMCAVHRTLRPGWLGWPWNGSHVFMNASTMPSARIMPPDMASWTSRSSVSPLTRDRFSRELHSCSQPCEFAGSLSPDRARPAVPARFPHHASGTGFHHRRVFAKFLMRARFTPGQHSQVGHCTRPARSSPCSGTRPSVPANPWTNTSAATEFAKDWTFMSRQRCDVRAGFSELQIARRTRDRLQ